jgi:hypothetical protein
MTISQFTCRTCKLVFRDRAEMAEHYKSDLHVENVNNRVAGRATVSLQEFQENKSVEKADVIKIRSTNLPVDDAMSDDSGSNEEFVVNPAESLFDDNVANDVEENITYMREKFHFTIPNESNLIDREGFVEYLQRKVSGGICIYCNKSFASIDAVQEHMKGKNHQRIKYLDNEAEYSEFYQHIETVPQYSFDERGACRTASGKVIRVKQEKKPLHRPGFARLRDHYEESPAKRIGYLKQASEGGRTESAMRHLQVAARGSHTTISRYIEGAEKTLKHNEPVAVRARNTEIKTRDRMDFNRLTSNINNRSIIFEGRT